jgi:hypothetical protein
MNDDSTGTREREASGENGAGTKRQEKGGDGAKSRISMLFSASGWTFNVRLGRSGREEGEGVILMGEVSYRTPSGERRIHPARAMVVKADARKRLDLVLSQKESVITIPLEPFAMQRLQERLKELVSGYGMNVRIGFSAEETNERQILEAVDFAFSSAQRGGHRQQHPGER